MVGTTVFDFAYFQKNVENIDKTVKQYNNVRRSFL